MFGGYMKDKAYGSKLASLQLKGKNIESYSYSYQRYTGIHKGIDNF
jgi:hypothetical protein